MEYQARCHCGRVRFSFRSPEITTGVRCDCSLCLRRGELLLQDLRGLHLYRRRRERQGRLPRQSRLRRGHRSARARDHRHRRQVGAAGRRPAPE